MNAVKAAIPSMSKVEAPQIRGKILSFGFAQDRLSLRSSE